MRSCQSTCQWAKVWISALILYRFIDNYNELFSIDTPTMHSVPLPSRDFNCKQYVIKSQFNDFTCLHPITHRAKIIKQHCGWNGILFYRQFVAFKLMNNDQKKKKLVSFVANHFYDVKNFIVIRNSILYSDILFVFGYGYWFWSKFWHFPDDSWN